jgi:hypothetical protein
LILFIIYIVPFHKNIGFWNDGTERYAKPKPAPPKPKVSVLPDGIVQATEGVDIAELCVAEEEYSF